MSDQQANVWICSVCGYIHHGTEPPEFCPNCGAPKDQFEPQIESTTTSSKERKKPQITCLQNGPYCLELSSFTPEIIENIQPSQLEKCSTTSEIALCRCGGSNKKPFCDGTHEKNGFTDKKITDGSLDKRKDHVGQKIIIHYNRALCSASENCVKNLPSVFKEKGDPWIYPDNDTVDRIIETIKKCPSGALSYSIDGVEYRDQDREPKITVAQNGPYEVTGGIELVDQVRCEGASTEHYTLCRCGGSKNKPFCDGTHWEINFSAE